MNDIELFEQARRRVQNKQKRNRKCVTNKDVIIDQEKEILYYREKIQRLMNNNTHIDTVDIDTTKTERKLNKIIKLLERIKELDSNFNLSNVIEADKDTTLIFKVNSMIKRIDMNQMERELTDKLQCKCICLGPNVELDNAVRSGIDFGEKKDYTTNVFYDGNGNIVKEVTTQYK